MSDRNFLLQDFQWTDLRNIFLIDRKGIFEFINCFSEMIRGGGILCDFGCGTEPYRSLFKVKEYIGIDVEVSGNRNSRSAEVLYDGKQIPFEEGFFDYMLASQCFEHITNLNEIIKEICRVLKTGGLLCVTVPLTNPEHEIPYDFRRFTSFGIRRFLEENGFEILDIQNLQSFRDTIGQMKIMYWNSTRHEIIKRFVKYFENALFVLRNSKSKTGMTMEIGIIARKI